MTWKIQKRRKAQWPPSTRGGESFLYPETQYQESTCCYKQCCKHNFHHHLQRDVWVDKEHNCNGSTLPDLELCKCSFLSQKKSIPKVGLQNCLEHWMNYSIYRGLHFIEALFISWKIKLGLQVWLTLYNHQSNKGRIVWAYERIIKV